MVFVKKLTLVALSVTIAQLPLMALRHERMPRKAIAKSVHYDVPSGYKQLGTTDLYYAIKKGGIDAGSVRIGSIDLIGKFGSQYYSSTYSDNGYVVAMQVEGNEAVFADCQNGTSIDGVVFSATIEPQGEMAKITYTISNTNDSVDKVVSVGAYDDAYVGNTIDATITKKKDSLGNVYGISLFDRAGAQLCVIFGDGLVGVTGVDDYWFGSFHTNTSAYKMSGNYDGDYDSNYMVENGIYDCGIGWCWKNKVVKAGSSITLSYLIAIGEVNLEPNSSFEVTPDDPEGWNDLSRPHRLTLEGDYESPAGQNGKIEYAVEDSEEWIALTDELESGSSFTASLVALFNPELPVHTIRFKTVDAVGNTSLLTPITYKDVSFQEIQGIENKVYNWGDSIYQTAISCELMSDQYEIANYRNNVNAGVASFNIEGVFPYTIGRKTYNFTIDPRALEGDIEFAKDMSYSYTGSPFTPEWYFSYERQNELIANQDYSLVWKDNVYPGTATLQLQGINNFSGTLQNSFFIDKAQLRADMYSLNLPSEDITFDNVPHPATYTKSEGVGEISFYYSLSTLEELSTDAPINIGKYDIFAEIAEGSLYYGLPIEKIGTFTIYQFDEADWAAIERAVPLLTQKGWLNPWDLSGGISSASSFNGLIIEEGHVIGIDLSDAGLSGSFPIELASFNNVESINLSNNNFDGSLESILAFAAQNPLMFAKIQELNISGNSFSGNIGAFASAFPSLVSLNASDNHISDVYPMISPNVKELNIGQQIIDRIIEFDFKSINSISSKDTFYKSINGEIKSGNVYSLKIMKHFGGESGYVIKGARGSNLTDDYPPSIDMQSCFGTIRESEYNNEEVALFTFDDAGNGYVNINCINDSITPVVRLATISSEYAGSVQRLTSSNSHLAPYNLWRLQEVGEGQFRILAGDSNYGWDASGNIGTASSSTRGDIMLYSGGDYFTPILEYSNYPLIQIPTILLYNHQEQAYNKPLRLKCTADDGWSVILTYNSGQINFTDVSEQNAYYGNSGDILNVVALASNGYSPEAYLSMKLEFSEGDANFNGSVDILDLQSTLNYMFGEYTGKPYNFTAANIWSDDIINVRDAVGIVNLLMSDEPNSIAYMQRKNRAMLLEENDVAEAKIMLEDGVLAIESSKPIAAFDLTLRGDAHISNELSSLGFMTSTRSYNGTTRIIGYSLSGATIPSNTIICTLDNPSSDVIAAKLADRDANEVKSKVGVNITTGIESVKADNLENCEIYTLDGVRVSDKNLAIGKIYIIKSDKGTYKVIVSQ